jgi:hypothetical protein
MSQDDPQSAIGAFLDRAHAEQTGFLAELVKGPSDNPPGDCARHAAGVAGLGFAVEQHPVPKALVRASGMVSVTNLIVRERRGRAAFARAHPGERCRLARNHLPGAPGDAGGSAQARARSRALGGTAATACRGGDGRTDPDLWRAALHRRAARRGDGRAERALRRRTAHAPEANAHAAEGRLPLADLRRATEVIALTLLDLLTKRGP